MNWCGAYHLVSSQPPFYTSPNCVPPPPCPIVHKENLPRLKLHSLSALKKCSHTFSRICYLYKMQSFPAVRMSNPALPAYIDVVRQTSNLRPISPKDSQSDKMLGESRALRPLVNHLKT